MSIATRQFGLLPVVLVLLRVDLALLPVNLALLRVNLALLLVNLVLLRVFLVSVKLVLSCAPENCIYPLAVAARNLAANGRNYMQGWNSERHTVCRYTADARTPLRTPSAARLDI